MRGAGSAIAVLGGGLAGLAVPAALDGAGHGPVTVLEATGETGGAARTVSAGPYRFDLGGHRFYTRKEHVLRFVTDLLGDELIEVDRRSRILIRGAFVDYPLTPLGALRGVGIQGSLRVLADYLRRRAAAAESPEASFEQWVLGQFGRSIHEVFFRPYTEKVWGIPCPELSADFAGQRIRGLSLGKVVRSALRGDSENSSNLIRRFWYPRGGFGRLPERMAESLRPPGRVLLRTRPVAVHHREGAILGVDHEGPSGPGRLDVDHLVSTIPLETLVSLLRPEAPPEVRSAAARLTYRDLVIVFLGLHGGPVSPDHWTYFPDAGTPLARMHEPPNWSAQLAPPGRTSLVVEWFATRGDEVWRRGDRDLVRATRSELRRLGILGDRRLDLSRVIRVRRAYPLYRLGYRRHRQTVLGYLEGFGNLHLSGRNGRFLYTSSDHYLDMSLKIAENIRGANHDIGAIGLERGYAES